jgi:TolB-like protein/Flp pilus assembly protein TadD
MVLPFKLLGGEPSQSYIAEGLTSGVTQDLGRIRDAFVLPATTAFAYREKTLTIPALAQDAGVRFVLTGEVQIQGPRLRIRAQLADGAADRQVWSEVFEGELTQLFELKDQITARIANSTERQMVVLAAGESQRKRSTPQGADLALQFRALRLQPDSLALSLKLEGLARQWVAAEPKNVDALAGLAWVLALRPVNFRSEVSNAEQDRLVREASDLANRAIALEANHPAALLIKAWSSRRSDPDAAIRLLERAIELDPQFRVAYNDLGLWLQQEDPARALKLLHQGLALDPKSPDKFELNIGSTHLWLGQYEEAVRWGERCTATMPEYAYCPELLAAAHAMLGHTEQARDAVARMLKLSPNYSIAKEWHVSSRAAPEVRDRIVAIEVALKAAGLPD